LITLLSVDDHIVEPAHVWTDRLPAKFNDRVPHVVETDRRQPWKTDGAMERTMGLNAVAGKPREEWSFEPARFEDMIPGSYNPEERRKDMLSNGISARQRESPMRAATARSALALLISECQDTIAALAYVDSPRSAR
jgi:hypothetical protein